MLPSLLTEPLADSPYQYHFPSSGDCSIPAACASMRLPSVSVQGGHVSSKHGRIIRFWVEASVLIATGGACAQVYDWCGLSQRALRCTARGAHGV
eukprot:scaffold60660_cov59-Phaeocystis_antarctica.AAC.6